MTTDRDAEIERLKSLLASTQSDLARDSSRANEAARLAADARDELDTVRQQLADAKEQAGWCDNDRDRLSLALDDAKTRDRAAEGRLA